jgi:hypothetical protein
VPCSVQTAIQEAANYDSHFLQCIAIIATDIINWKTTFCKTASDSSWSYKLPGFCCEVHSRQYIQLCMCSILEQSTMYQGGNFPNKLLSTLHVRHPNLQTTTGWYRQLVATTFNSLRNLFFKWRKYWSMKNRIYQFLAHFPVYVCKVNFNNMVVFQEFVLPSYFVDSFLAFLKQSGVLYLLIMRGGNLSLPSAGHSGPLAWSTVTHTFNFCFRFA